DRRVLLDGDGLRRGREHDGGDPPHRRGRHARLALRLQGGGAHRAGAGVRARPAHHPPQRGAAKHPLAHGRQDRAFGRPDAGRGRGGGRGRGRPGGGGGGRARRATGRGGGRGGGGGTAAPPCPAGGRGSPP